MPLAPVLLFDLRSRRIVELDRPEARQALADHRFALIDPPPSLDLVAVCWWAMRDDPLSTMPTLRGPAIYFSGRLWRRVVVVPVPRLPSASARIHFEQRIRTLPSPERLRRWYGYVAEWHRRNAQPGHAVAAE